MAATGAFIDMATQSCGAAAQNGANHLHMQPVQPGRRILKQFIRRGADDIGHLQEGPGHYWCTFLTLVRLGEVERVQRAQGGFEVQLGHVQVTTGCFQIGVSQQQLNGA